MSSPRTDLALLETISTQLGLSKRTLYEYRKRYDDFPDPVLSVSDRIKMYDVDAVEAWHVALREGDR